MPTCLAEVVNNIVAMLTQTSEQNQSHVLQKHVYDEHGRSYVTDPYKHDQLHVLQRAAAKSLYGKILCMPGDDVAGNGLQSVMCKIGSCSPFVGCSQPSSLLLKFQLRYTVPPSSWK